MKGGAGLASRHEVSARFASVRRAVGEPTARCLFGDSAPARGFATRWAELQDRALDALEALSASRGARERILAKVLHATLVRPCAELFWDGDDPWRLYFPFIEKEDLPSWPDAR